MLSGNWDAPSGRADLVVARVRPASRPVRIALRAMGQVQFAFCVAASHPLASLDRPLGPADLNRYSSVVVADTSRGLPPQTRGILSEQPVLVMPTMPRSTQVRGLGCGYLPVTLAAPYLAQGLLTICEAEA